MSRDKINVKKLHILVADEDSASLQKINAMTRAAGMDCKAVGCGVDAVKELLACDSSECKYDCVLISSNIDAPGGAEIARMIRSRFPELPLALMSAADSIENRIAARTIGGASRHITKPAHSEALTEAIDTAMSNVNAKKKAGGSGKNHER